MAIIDFLQAEWVKSPNLGEDFLIARDGSRVTKSSYQPDENVRNTTSMIINSFNWADLAMRKPRREYNDYSTLTRMMYDQMAFNIYQPNNGQAIESDITQGWKSNAIRPIIRNKVISIAAHTTARMLFPKWFAYDEQSEEQEKAAMIMRDLTEWASEQNDYDRNTLHAVINACVNPASIVHLEYVNAYRTIKTEKENGKWKTEEILDESQSGFRLTQVPVDELYVADFYTEDIQNQSYVIWRRVQSYQTMQAKYGKHENFKYVKPGMQVVYNDPNVGFYEVYDSNLRQSLCEEVIFYSKPLDLQIVLVNGVMLSDYDQPNPRMDKQYPFIKFYYEPFDEGRAFYGKSLAFKMQPDADIINTLYPMIIDGTYLNIFAPMVVAGEETIGTDVMIPGAITTLTNPESTVVPIRAAQDIRQGMETLFKVEESINQSSQSPILQGQSQVGSQTAYEISKQEQNAKTVLGPFIKMVGSYVKQYGNLIKSDILQYITLPEVDKIVDNGELIYQTIIVHDRQVDGGKKSRKIKFDLSIPEELSEEKELEMSYDVLEEQGGEDSGQEIAKVNPQLFRELKYMCVVSPDVINPMSDDLERAFGLEVFDRSIQYAQVAVNTGDAPVDLELVYKDFVLSNYPKSQKDVNKYIKKEEPLEVNGQQLQPAGQPPMPGQPQVGGSPLNAMKNNFLSTK